MTFRFHRFLRASRAARFSEVGRSLESLHSDDPAAGQCYAAPSMGPAWRISVLMKALRLVALARYRASSAFLTSSS